MSKSWILAACAALFASGVASVANAGQRYNVLEDAVVAQAKRWQSGEKARP